MSAEYFITIKHINKKSKTVDRTPIFRALQAICSHNLTMSDHLLIWMVDRSLERTYQSLSGARRNFMGKYGCTVNVYRACVKELEDNGYIKRMPDNTGGKYPVWEIRNEFMVLKEVKSRPCKVTINFM